MSDFTAEQLNRVVPVDIESEMKKSFLDYSMSVIVSRALPDVRDGLKPVHRRIIYTMYENGLSPDKAYRKCADTVGAVLGRYHPHGDASVYDAMVRLAQDFSMRYPLVDGHGNFGSVDGDPPAAYRYTESRMSRMALHLVADIDKETVDFTPNYDDRLKEPAVLPSRYPNLLVNGSMGIAVGMATNIPPHNMAEVIDGVCALIENPDLSLEGLMEHIQGPDFPTGGIIMGRSGIRSAYGTGRGRIILRARAEIEEMGHGGRQRIVVTEIPYGVNKARLIESIADLVKEKRIEQISDLRDESDREGMRIVIELKRDANAQLVLNQLYTYSQMQETVGVILLALEDGQPKVLTLKEMMADYIRFQEEIITRRTRFELRKAQERAHILEGLRRAIDIVDEVIAAIRATKGGIAEAKAAIMEQFGFDDVQAAAIVAFRLGQLAGLEIEKVLSELAALEEKIAEYTAILSDEGRVLAIVKEELSAIRAKYADPRRTEIQQVSGEVDVEDLIPQADCVVTLTRYGYIKRMPVDTYRAQNRGGRGVLGMTRREEDLVTQIADVNSHDYLIFFTTRGRAFRVKGYEIPENNRSGKGMNIVNLLMLEEGEQVSAMIKMADGQAGGYFAMVTRQGIIKRTPVEDFKNIRKAGLNAVNLDEGDSLVSVLLTDGHQQLLLATRAGMAIRFPEQAVRPMGRTARGVRAIRLAGGDQVVDMTSPRPGDCLLTVSEQGAGRRTPLEQYRLQSRGGKGILNFNCAKHGPVAGARAVGEEEDVLLISEDGVVIRVAATQVNVQSRYGGGVRMMRLAEGSRVVSMAVTAHEEGEGDSQALPPLEAVEEDLTPEELAQLQAREAPEDGEEPEEES